MINLIACVTKFQNKLAIGKQGNLLFKLKDDMAFFKNITTNKLSPNSQLSQNIVLMGRKTFFSIPSKYRPLANRINLVLTNNPDLIKLSPIPQDLTLTKNLYYIDLFTFKKIYHKYNPNVFVIGGSELYHTFIHQADNLYITQVQTHDGKDIKFDPNDEPDTFMEHFNTDYELISTSEKYNDYYKDTKIKYRILHYQSSKTMSEEHKYLHFMNNILTEGNKRDDRTGVGTMSIFGNQLKFDISTTIPLMTTKYVPFNTIAEELLWFCRGDTDAKILQQKNIKIWNGNTSREFLNSQGLSHYPEGVLGAGYGFQWRFFGANYNPSFADTSQCNTSLIGGFDQLKYIEHLLEHDPFSRRIVLSAWNPADFHKTSLLPCHILLQFYVEEINNEKHLSCQFYMRSNDVFLANVFNIVSYSLLTYILAKRHNMKPKNIIYTCGDSHIYLNHIQQVTEQLKRTPRPFPKLIIDDNVKHKNWSEITTNDFELIGYFPHPHIKAPMAI